MKSTAAPLLQQYHFSSQFSNQGVHSHAADTPISDVPFECLCPQVLAYVTCSVRPSGAGGVAPMSQDAFRRAYCGEATTSLYALLGKDLTSKVDGTSRYRPTMTDAGNFCYIGQSKALGQRVLACLYSEAKAFRTVLREHVGQSLGHLARSPKYKNFMGHLKRGARRLLVNLSHEAACHITTRVDLRAMALRGYALPLLSVGAVVLQVNGMVKRGYGGEGEKIYVVQHCLVPHRQQGSEYGIDALVFRQDHVYIGRSGEHPLGPSSGSQERNQCGRNWAKQIFTYYPLGGSSLNTEDMDDTNKLDEFVSLQSGFSLEKKDGVVWTRFDTVVRYDR